MGNTIRGRRCRTGALGSGTITGLGWGAGRVSVFFGSFAGVLGAGDDFPGVFRAEPAVAAGFFAEEAAFEAGFFTGTAFFPFVEAAFFGAAGFFTVLETVFVFFFAVVAAFGTIFTADFRTGAFLGAGAFFAVTVFFAAVLGFCFTAFIASPLFCTKLCLLNRIIPYFCAYAYHFFEKSPLLSYTYNMRLIHNCVIALCLWCMNMVPLFAAETDHLASFSDPSRIWGNGIERVIEEAYRACFKMRIIGGKVMNIRMPFAENNERDTLIETGWEFIGGGKGNPAMLWPAIEAILDSEDFSLYVQTLSDGYEQVIIFDIAAQSWNSSRDLFDIARMKAGSYRGLPHRPYVFATGKGIEETDVYNYLYCIGLAGMDCSGFVWHILSYTARQGGLDLGRALSRSLGVRRGSDPAWYVGTSFFDSKSSHIIPVTDRISDLRPADIILFRGLDGAMAHSAVIQSIDLKKGIIRYLQSTDEAPLSERGVHESFIYFDPARPRAALSDPEIRWTQQRQAPFPGEKASPFSDDGERYRAFSELGGGRVVRLRLLVPLIEKMQR